VRRRAALAAAALAGVAVAAACGDDDGGDTGSESSTPSSATAVGEPLPVAAQDLTMVGTDYAFALEGGDGELDAGWTDLTFRNDGEEAHQVMFARLLAGVDLAEVAEAAAGDPSGGSAIEFVEMLGGVSYIGPGQTIRAMVELPEGMVLAMCYVPTAEGVAHADLGMSTTLAVGAPGPVETQPDSASGRRTQGTIELADDGYRFPDALPDGWYRVANTDSGTGGEGLHELSMMRLERAASDDELAALMEALADNATPPLSVEALGGMGALSPGLDGYLHLDLPAGDYVAVDFMPDPRETRPHLLDGYYAPFSSTG
jgi:hypothetical protein